MYLGSLDSEKWFDIQGFANFTLCREVSHRERRTGGMTGVLTPYLSKGSNGGQRYLLITVSLIISRLIKIDFKQLIAAIRPHRKFRMVFYNFVNSFYGRHCCCTETSITGKYV